MLEPYAKSSALMLRLLPTYRPTTHCKSRNLADPGRDNVLHPLGLPVKYALAPSIESHYQDRSVALPGLELECLLNKQNRYRYLNIVHNLYPAVHRDM